LPIRADYVGLRVDADATEMIKVHLVEEDGIDQVIVEPMDDL
jgi:pyrimidine operon attenuation protein/uracil phosphoribosyltransferase